MVVLPDPDSPISATTSPRATSKLTPLTIGTFLAELGASVDPEVVDLEQGH